MCGSLRGQAKAGRITTVTAEEFMDLIDQMIRAISTWFTAHGNQLIVRPS